MLAGQNFKALSFSVLSKQAIQCT